MRLNGEDEDTSEDEYDVNEYIYELMEEVILGQDQKAKSKLQSEPSSRICFGGGCGGLLIPDIPPKDLLEPPPDPMPIGPPGSGGGGLPPIQDGGEMGGLLQITVDDLLHDGSDPDACEEDWNEVMNNFDLEEENEENSEFDMLNALLEEEYNGGITLFAHGLTVFFILIFTMHFY